MGYFGYKNFIHGSACVSNLLFFYCWVVYQYLHKMQFVYSDMLLKWAFEVFPVFQIFLFEATVDPHYVCLYLALGINGIIKLIMSLEFYILKHIAQPSFCGLDATSTCFSSVMCVPGWWRNLYVKSLR